MMTVFLILLTSAAVLGLAVQQIMLRRVTDRQERLIDKFRDSYHRLRQAEQELAALCSASMGAGDHVVKLEQQVKRIIERQDTLEMRVSSDRPYAQASQLVNKGADIDELVDTCGLTRGEAELLVMMQRGAA